jgi:pre-mRNA-splicing factor CWC22
LDKSSPEIQRLSWDALRKSIMGIVNRVNIIVGEVCLRGAL